MSQASSLGVGISDFVSVGNKADVSGNDLLQYWADDPHTDVILLYLESFGNPRKFARLARRTARTKPIVAVKGGRSNAGRRAASSHTAALASPDIAVDALFRQAGVIRVDTLDQLFATAMVLAHQPLPAGRRVAIVSNAGGPGILAADACAGAGLEVPELGAVVARRAPRVRRGRRRGSQSGRSRRGRHRRAVRAGAARRPARRRNRRAPRDLRPAARDSRRPTWHARSRTRPRPQATSPSSRASSGTPARRPSCAATTAPVAHAGRFRRSRSPKPRRTRSGGSPTSPTGGGAPSAGCPCSTTSISTARAAIVRVAALDRPSRRPRGSASRRPARSCGASVSRSPGTRSSPARPTRSRRRTSSVTRWR